MTKAMKCAIEVAKWLGKKELNSDVSIYVEHKRYHVNDAGELVYDIDAEGYEYIDYAGKIMSISFEGPLYDILNYSWESEHYAKLEEEFAKIFKSFGYYFELCNSWSLTVAEM